MAPTPRGVTRRPELHLPLGRVRHRPRRGVIPDPIPEEALNETNVAAKPGGRPQRAALKVRASPPVTRMHGSRGGARSEPATHPLPQKGPVLNLRKDMCVPVGQPHHGAGPDREVGRLRIVRTVRIVESDELRDRQLAVIVRLLRRAYELEKLGVAVLRAVVGPRGAAGVQEPTAEAVRALAGSRAGPRTAAYDVDSFCFRSCSAASQALRSSVTCDEDSSLRRPPSPGR